MAEIGGLLIPAAGGVTVGGDGSAGFIKTAQCIGGTGRLQLGSGQIGITGSRQIAAVNGLFGRRQVPFCGGIGGRLRQLAVAAWGALAGAQQQRYKGQQHRPGVRNLCHQSPSQYSPCCR